MKTLAAVVVAAFLPSLAVADYSWIGAQNSYWHDALNWQDGLLPNDVGAINFSKDSAGFWNVVFTNQVETVAGPLYVNGVAGSGVIFDAEPTITEVEPEEPGGESTTETTYDNGLSLVGEAKDLWIGGTNQYGSAEFRHGDYSFGSLWLDGGSSLTLTGTDSFSLAGNANFDSGTVTAENADLKGAAVNIGNTPDATARVVKNGGDWHFTESLYIGNDAGHNVNASFVQNDGELTVDGYFCIGKNSNAANTAPDCSFTLNGGTVNAIGRVLVGDWGVPGGKYKIVVNGGEFNADNYITLSGSDKNGGRADGEFYVSNGVVTVANSFLFSRGNTTADNKMLLALEGGTLKAKDIRYATNSDASGCTRLGQGTVLFDGGTFAAAAAGDILPANANLAVKVGAKGATIDTDGNNVSISSALTTADGLTADGGLRLVGGGKVAMNGAADYLGATTVVLPTQIEVADTAAKDDVLSGGLFVDVSQSVLPIGRFAVLTITGGDLCTAADLAKCSCSDPSVTFDLSLDEKSICAVFPASAEAFVWTANADGNFSTPANWTVGGEPSTIAPTNGSEVVFMTDTPVTATCDYDLSVSKLIWASGYASASITNAAAETLTVATDGVKNYSGNAQRLDLPVEYKNGESWSNITYEGARVEFWGGVKGNLPTHTSLYGNYTLTASSWSLSSAITLMADSTLTASNTALTLNGNQLLKAEAGSKMTVKSVNALGLGSVFGSFLGDLTITGSFSFQPDRYGASINNGISGVLSFGDLYVRKTSKWTGSGENLYFNPAGEIVVTGSGVNDVRGRLNVGQNGKTTVFRSASNWSIYTTHWTSWTVASQDTHGLAIVGGATMVIDTADYNGASEGHTVRIYNKSAVIGTYPNRISGAGALEARGNGTLRFESNCAYTGGFAAYDSVTVNVYKSVQLGNCDATMNDHSVLRLENSDSGTVTLPKALTFAAGTQLQIPELVIGVKPLKVKSLAFTGVDADNKVTLNIKHQKNGAALRKGAYEILEATDGLDANVGENFEIVYGADDNFVTYPTNEIQRLVVHNNKLYLAFGDLNGIWIGDVDDNMNNADNWLDNQLPYPTATLNFLAVTAAKTLNANIENAPDYATLTTGDGVVTFNGELAVNWTTNISNIAVAADSRFTVKGDMVFTGAGTQYICEKNDGEIVVTGRVLGDGSNLEVLPSNAASTGYFVVGGLYTNCSVPSDSGEDIYTFRVSNGSDKFVVGVDGIKGAENRGYWTFNNTSHSAYIQAKDADFAIESPIGIGADNQGLTINTTGYSDTAAHTVTVAAPFGSSGKVFFTGTGAVVCDYVAANSNTIAVSNGTTLVVNSGKNPTKGTLTLDAGSTLVLTNLAADATALTVGTLTLPEEGKVNLVVKGDAPLANGLYKLYAPATALDPSVIEKFTLDASDVASEASLLAYGTGDSSALYLIVGPRSALPPNVWTGLGADNKFSTVGNWLNEQQPVADVALDFTSVGEAVSIDADTLNEATFPALLTGSAVITFSGSVASKAITDTSKIGVGANATVTLDGDLLFTGSGTKYVVYKVDADGKFIVTGKVGVSEGEQVTLQAQYSPGTGTIVAGGLVNDGTSWIFIAQDNNATTQTWAIGPDGISGTTADSRGLWVYSNAKVNPVVRPNTNDFAVSLWMYLRQKAKSFTLDTTGLDGEGHVITLDAGFNNGHETQKGGPLVVSGAGKVVINHVTKKIGDFPAYNGDVTVSETATLAINSGKVLTSGNVILNPGTTFELPDSSNGGVTHAGIVQFKGGTRLVVGGLSSDVVPLTTSQLIVQLADNQGTKVTLSKDGVAPKPGTYTLITVTGQTLIDDHVSRLTLDDPVLDASKVTFSLSSDKKSIILTIKSSFPSDWNDGNPVTDDIIENFGDWMDEFGLDDDDLTPEMETDFLLGQDPNDPNRIKTLGITAIDVIDGEAKTVTLTSTHDLSKANGYVYVLIGGEPAPLTATALTEAGVSAEAPAVVSGFQIQKLEAAPATKMFSIGVGYTDYSKANQ